MIEINSAIARFAITATIFFSTHHAAVAEIGTASGKGTIERFIVGDPDGNTEPTPFTPKYSFAFREKENGSEFFWIVLSEKEPPITELQGAKDRGEARRLWCEREKTPFVAVKLDPKNVVDLYFLCPGNGQLNTEMVSTANGLDSVIVKIDFSADRVKGTLVGGDGSCPDEAGENKYCTEKSNYSFDAPILK